MSGKVVELDVREDLKNKLEPFQKIMTAVKGLEKDDIFILHSTINPTPLITLMKTKGFKGEAEKLEEDHYKTTFIQKKKGIGLFKKDEEIKRPDCPVQDGSGSEI